MVKCFQAYNTFLNVKSSKNANGVLFLYVSRLIHLKIIVVKYENMYWKIFFFVEKNKQIEYAQCSLKFLQITSVKNFVIVKN